MLGDAYAPAPRTLASLGDRLVGQIVDSLVALAPVVVAVILASISSTLGAIAVIAAVAFALYYILFADGFANGQSYGKRLVHTSVVDATTGEPCTFWQSFLRNLLLSLLGIIDWVFIFGSKRQRLGDKAANTVVIKVD
ncbi:MAG: RDD family protein [Gemmatimonadaceae bacterium]